MAAAQLFAVVSPETFVCSWLCTALFPGWDAIGA